MEPISKACKRPETSRDYPQYGEDRLSSLPEPIIHHILSFLKTCEVIKTSALSRHWRYLWTLMPCLDFDTRVHDMDSKQYPVKKSFKEFVYWVLACGGSSDLQRVRLCCTNYYKIETVERWIRIAILRRVKELDLTFCPHDAFLNSRPPEPTCEAIELPHSLVSCESLEKLTLCLLNCVLKLSYSGGFKRLTSLSLSMVELSDESVVKRLLAGCPLLEHLSLHSCRLMKLKVLDISSQNLKSLKIENMSADKNRVFEDGLVRSVLKVSCPKLISFELYGHMALDYVLLNMSSLQKAQLYLLPPIHVGETSSELIQVGYRMCKILSGLHHAKSLTLTSVFVVYFLCALGEPRCFSGLLHNLKSLRLCTLVNECTMTTVMYLLEHSPNLEYLTLLIEKTCDWNCCWGIDDAEISLLTYNLKSVHFLNFKGEEGDLEVIEFLLGNADALEEMIFDWETWKAHSEKSAETIKRISKFSKSSSTVKLTFHDPQ